MQLSTVGSGSAPPDSLGQSVRELLSVCGLTVRYCVDGREFTALSDVTFDMASAEIVGMLGESGCGKTTLALSLMRLLPSNATVTGGSVSFCGTDLLGMSETELRKVRGAKAAIIYQDSSVLNPVIRVGEQIHEVLRAHRRIGRREGHGEVRRVLSSIGFRDTERIYEAYPHQLSGGQRQRIAIAQALICKPSLVIADEPTASVDPETAREIVGVLKQLRNDYGVSVLFISHDPILLAEVADRVIVMYSGKVVEQGLVDDVFSHPLHPYTNALLQCARPVNPAAEAGRLQNFRLPFIPGGSPDPMEEIPGCDFASRCADRMRECDLARPKQIESSHGRFVRCLKYEGN